MDAIGVPCDNTANMEQAEEELMKAFEKYGMGGIKNFFDKKLEEWKDVPLNIGITGSSGVGKSSFINAIRGLEASDVGAAPVGVTTMTVEQYPHPQNKQLVLYDLPGVGTPTFPKDTYFEDPRIGFGKFDVFLIMAAKRFTENDLWLAKGIRDRKKEFLFIQTHIVTEIKNEMYDRGLKKPDNEQYRDVMKYVCGKVRNECEKYLKDLIPSHETAKKVFLIDNHDINNPFLDMNTLTRELIDNFQALKKNAFVLSLTALTPNIIEAKEKVLRGRIWKKSALSALGGSIPIPGMSLLIDVALIMNEVAFYRDQLGLDEETLKQAAANVDMPWDIFKERTNLESLADLYSHSGILQCYSFLTISETAEKSVEFAIPMFGYILGGTLSYLSTKRAINDILDRFIKVAKDVNECIKHAVSTSV